MRNKRYIRIYYLITILSLVTALVAFVFFKDEKKDIKEKQVFSKITTNDLIFGYRNKDLDQFIEQIIEVDGVLKKVTTKNGVCTLYLTDNKESTFILCELEKNQKRKASQLIVGNQVKIKGILKGHLKDVILLNCVIL